jgi:hypothetical protein
MARPKLLEGTPYAGRRESCAVATLNLEREARDLLKQWAPTTMGAFVSRLIYEHRARQEERERLPAQR